MNKHIVLFVMVLLGGLIVIAVYYNKTHMSTPAVVVELQEDLNQEFKLHSVRVLGGGEFEFTLKNGDLVKGFLGVRVTPSAKNEVIKLINSAKGRGRIVVHSKFEDGWLVDVYLTPEKQGNDTCQEIHLTQWLQQKNFIYRGVE